MTGCTYPSDCNENLSSKVDYKRLRPNFIALIAANQIKALSFISLARNVPVQSNIFLSLTRNVPKLTRSMCDTCSENLD